MSKATTNDSSFMTFGEDEILRRLYINTTHGGQGNQYPKQKLNCSEDVTITK